MSVCHFCNEPGVQRCSQCGVTSCQSHAHGILIGAPKRITTGEIKKKEQQDDDGDLIVDPDIWKAIVDIVFRRPLPFSQDAMNDMFSTIDEQYSNHTSESLEVIFLHAVLDRMHNHLMKRGSFKKYNQIRDSPDTWIKRRLLRQIHDANVFELQKTFPFETSSMDSWYERVLEQHNDSLDGQQRGGTLKKSRGNE